MTRAFVAIYVALSFVVIAGLLRVFVEVLPRPVAPRGRAALEYLEAR